MTTSKYLILSCDGGGIRGLIPALLLQQLPSGFLDNVYLLAGTSTGGIISLALATNVPVSEIVNLYETDGATIFTPSACISAKSANMTSPPPMPANVGSTDWWQYIVDHLLDILCVWYDNTGLKTAVQNVLGSSATATLNSLIPAAPATPWYVLVNTLQLCNNNNVWTPLQLTNLPNIANNTSGTTQVIDAAMSTSAAPIYFPPYPHPVYGFCADGGLFANNPGTIALTTLVESGVALEDIWMLSLSTGITQDSYPAWAINGLGTENAGPLFWFWPTTQTGSNSNGSTFTPAIPLMGAFFDATAAVDTYQCQQLLGTRYQRADVPLSQPIALNDYSPATITAMKNSVNDYVTKSIEWSGILSWIKANFPS